MLPLTASYFFQHALLPRLGQAVRIDGDRDATCSGRVGVRPAESTAIAPRCRASRPAQPAFQRDGWSDRCRRPSRTASGPGVSGCIGFSSGSIRNTSSAALAALWRCSSPATHVCEFHYLHHDRTDARTLTQRRCRQASSRPRSKAASVCLLPVFYAFGGFGAQPCGKAQRRFVNAEQRCGLHAAARRHVSNVAGAQIESRCCYGGQQ